jgi:hypothetical protein
MEETTDALISETPNDADPQSETLTTTQIGETPKSTTSKISDDTSKELERLQAAVKRANAEAKENRLAAEELRKLKEELEASKLSETERLQKQYNDLKTQHEEYTQEQTERMIKHDVALEAAKLGVDPNLLDRVAKFLDWEEIDTDENGRPTNIRELVEQLVKDIPGLKSKSALSSGGATNPPRSTTTAPKELSWDVISKLTKAEYEANATRIQKWMAEHSRR